MTDATDATFESVVLERSKTLPVVVDLWAPWCGPCLTLAPILEEAVRETNGSVALVKVNIDENPRVAATFQVQSIPAVSALKDRAIVDHFTGAVPKQTVVQFLDGLIPMPTEADGLTMMGDEQSLRDALELAPNHPTALMKLAKIYIETSRSADAFELLARLPDSDEVRELRMLARARM